MSRKYGEDSWCMNETQETIESTNCIPFAYWVLWQNSTKNISSGFALFAKEKKKIFRDSEVHLNLEIPIANTSRKFSRKGRGRWDCIEGNISKRYFRHFFLLSLMR